MEKKNSLSFGRVLGYFALGFVILCFILEVGTRLRKDNNPAMDRYLHPYVMIGGFRHGGFFESRKNLDVNERPEAFGYYPKGFLGCYIFDGGTPVKSITDRGKFLYRDRAALADIKDGLPKVFIIGGSVAYGEGASGPNKRWYVDMERDLDRMLGGKRVHVISAANHSWVSTQERIDMDLYVLPKHPAMIIDVTGFNDANTQTSGTRPGDPYGMSVAYKKFESPFYFFLEELSKDSMFVRRFMLQDIYRGMDESWQHDPEKVEPVSVANVLLDNVAWMQRRCNQEHIPCYFFLQPYWDLTLKYRGLPPKFDDPRMAADYAQIMKQMKESKSVLRDFTHVFDDPKEPVPFIDPAHFNDRGHETFGQAIAKIVVRDKIFHSKR